MLAGVMLGDMTDRNLGCILGPQSAPPPAPKPLAKPARAPLRASVRTKSAVAAGKSYRV